MAAAATPPATGPSAVKNPISPLDPKKDVKLGYVREVGNSAVWSLSSCKPGFGIEQIRDNCLDTYWQSDGPQPHLVNIQFKKKMVIKDIWIYADYKADESYTPSKISIRSGTHFNDLQEIEVVELSEPTGWTMISLKDLEGRSIKAFMIQIAILANHQNGRDTHIRQIKIHTPVDNRPFGVDWGVPFTSPQLKSLSTIR